MFLALLSVALCDDGTTATLTVDAPRATLFELRADSPLNLTIGTANTSAPLLFSAMSMASVGPNGGSVQVCGLSVCLALNGSTNSSLCVDSSDSLFALSVGAIPLPWLVQLKIGTLGNFCRVAVRASTPIFLPTSNASAWIDVAVPPLGAVAFVTANAVGSVRAELCESWATQPTPFKLPLFFEIGGSDWGSWLSLGGFNPVLQPVLVRGAEATSNMGLGTSVAMPYAVLDRVTSFQLGAATANAVQWRDSAAQASVLLQPLPVLLESKLPLLNRTGPYGAADPIADMPISRFRFAVSPFVGINGTLTANISTSSKQVSVFAQRSPFVCGVDQWALHVVRKTSLLTDLDLENSACFVERAAANVSLLATTACQNATGDEAGVWLHFDWKDEFAALGSGESNEVRLVVSVRSAERGAFAFSPLSLRLQDLEIAEWVWWLTGSAIVAAIVVGACGVAAIRRRRRAQFQLVH